MATRELAEIKDKNGDVNELRDKKLADSIAKNTVVNTDNVRMVDTNGKEVFIARDSFISAIRNVLGGFILSNTKAEAPNIPVFDSNGDFGAITAANLASVLGVGDGFGDFFKPVGLYKIGVGSVSITTPFKHIASTSGHQRFVFPCFCVASGSCDLFVCSLDNYTIC